MSIRKLDLVNSQIFSIFIGRVRQRVRDIHSALEFLLEADLSYSGWVEATVGKIEVSWARSPLSLAPVRILARASPPAGVSSPRGVIEPITGQNLPEFFFW